MRIKLIGGIFVISILLMMSAYAQKQQTADDVIKKMTADLNLTSKQADKIKPIIVNNIAKREAIFNTATDKNVIEAKLAQSGQTETQEISQFLEPNQKNNFNIFVGEKQVLATQDQQSSGGTIHCDRCQSCQNECSWYSCNCRPNPGGTIHCDLCPTNCRNVCTSYSCNCRPGA